MQAPQLRSQHVLVPSVVKGVELPRQVIDTLNSGWTWNSCPHLSNAKHQPPPSEKQVARVTLGGRLHAFVSILYPCLNVSDYFEVEKL
jgi:hypothetical protein